MTINSPRANAIFDVGATVSLIAEAYDPDGRIVNFTLFVDDKVVSTANVVIYTSGVFPAGPHKIRARATDDKGGVTEVVSTFIVGASLVDNEIFAVWDGMNNALKAGDVTTALTFLTTGAQEKYQPIFEALLAEMPTIVASYSRPMRGQVTDGLAEYAIMRNIPEEGDTQVFYIYFSKNSNGKWLVDSM